jgi:mycoredoxin
MMSMSDEGRRDVQQPDAQPTEELSPIVMYTTLWCPDCWRAKQVMNSMQVEYTEVDISHDPEAADLVMQLNKGNRSVPTLVFPDGSVMTEPRTTALVEKLQSML